MGTEDLSKTVIPVGKLRCLPAMPLVLLLSFVPLSFLLAGKLSTQNPLDTAFQTSFFARREVWVDRLFSQAPLQLRRAALHSLQRALEPGFRDREVTATQRLDFLAKAAAILSGLAQVETAGEEPVFANEAEWQTFRLRFNMWLLALPAVVDPDRTKQDLAKVKAHHRRLYPQLRHAPVRRQEIEGGHLVHLTARAVLAYPKPARLELRLGIANLANALLDWAKREDSANPHGWRDFDLSLPFSTKDLSGSYEGHAFVAFDGTWPKTGAPSAHARFDVCRGFFKDLWRFIAMRETLGSASGDSAALPADMATLNVQAEELMRVFLFGETYVFRSWPLEALDEGLKLARNMLLGKSYVLSPSGDRVFGIQVKGGQSLPVRILWQEARAGGPARRAWIHFAPSTWNQDYAICGLGLTAEQLLRKPSTVHVFLAQDGTDTYLEGVQHLLEEHFGIDAAHTSIVGLLDGCTRARYALPMFKGRLDQMVFIGGAVADARLLANEKLRSIRIIAAYGLPKPEALKRSKQLQIESGSRKHVVFDSNELRSLSQALLRL